jgi:hypothetical protein
MTGSGHETAAEDNAGIIAECSVPTKDASAAGGTERRYCCSTAPCEVRAESRQPGGIRVRWSALPDLGLDLRDSRIRLPLYTEGVAAREVSEAAAGTDGPVWTGQSLQVQFRELSEHELLGRSW